MSKHKGQKNHRFGNGSRGTSGGTGSQTGAQGREDFGRREGGRGRRGKGGDYGGSAGTYWIYGRHAVLAVHANPERRIIETLATPELAGELNLPQVRQASHDDISRLVGEEAVHQGIAARVKPLESLAVEDVFHTKLVVILDQVSDPHNVGAIVRSAAAFGAGAVIVQDKHSPPEGAVMAKAASGALEVLPLVQVTNIARAMEQLQEQQFWCVGLDGAAKQTLNQLPKYDKVALVLGAEGPGMRRLVAESCDILVRLPISDKVESLNVSNAAAVALYELSKS